MKTRRTFTNIATLVRVKRGGHPSNYSQSDIANMLGFKNGQAISNTERGLCSFPANKIGKLSKILQIPQEEIVDAMVLDYRIYLLAQGATDEKENNTRTIEQTSGFETRGIRM